jgi:putative ABC transport system permease protein
MTLVLTNALDFEFVLEWVNIILGTGLAAIIGLISGILHTYCFKIRSS